MLLNGFLHSQFLYVQHCQRQLVLRKLKAMCSHRILASDIFGVNHNSYNRPGTTNSARMLANVQFKACCERKNDLTGSLFTCYVL